MVYESKWVSEMALQFRLVSVSGSVCLSKWAEWAMVWLYESVAG